MKLLNILQSISFWGKYMEQDTYGYVCFYNGKRVEVYASSSLGAQTKAAGLLKVSRKNQYKITVMLAEKNGKPVIHTPSF